MRRLAQFVADHPRLAFRIASSALAILLLATIDNGRALTAAEFEEIIVGEPVLMCLGEGEPVTEYFVAGGAYHADGRASRHVFGHWRLDSSGQVCVDVEGEPPDCRFVWRYGERLSWMWTNPSTFADFALLPEDPCEWRR